MGEYVIPGVRQANMPAIHYHVEQKLGEAQLDMRFYYPEVIVGAPPEEQPTGIRVVWESRTDAEVEALFADFVNPTDNWDRPLPDPVRLHLQHLRDYLAKDAAQITNAESVHVIKDLIRAVHYLNNRFETEG